MDFKNASPEVANTYVQLYNRREEDGIRIYYMPCPVRIEKGGN